MLLVTFLLFSSAIRKNKTLGLSYDKHFHAVAVEYLLRELPRKGKSIFDILVKTMASKNIACLQSNILSTSRTFYYHFPQNRMKLTNFT